MIAVTSNKETKVSRNLCVIGDQQFGAGTILNDTSVKSAWSGWFKASTNQLESRDGKNR